MVQFRIAIVVRPAARNVRPAHVRLTLVHFHPELVSQMAGCKLQITDYKSQMRDCR